MAEGITRTRAGLAGYFSRHIRALTHEVRRLLQAADRDSDPASITVLSGGPRGADHLADGAVVILKGGATVALFCQWAERNGVLTRGKPICDEDADEERDLPESEDHGPECDCVLCEGRGEPEVLRG